MNELFTIFIYQGSSVHLPTIYPLIVENASHANARLAAPRVISKAEVQPVYYHLQMSFDLEHPINMNPPA